MSSEAPNEPTEEDTRPAQPVTGRVRSRELPERVGRYRIGRELGRGGFGTVHLGQDEQLNRSVAIKIAHAELIADASDATAYLEEARIVAGLDHPHIVPLYDVGSTDEVPFFSVSKYIDGTDLSQKMRRFRFHPVEAARLTSIVAEALHFAHKQGLVHRDVKPGNILIDTQAQPFLVDFGLALREASMSDEPQYVGTPVYTSPEQARGEGHRVDGRSDIFSLGVVLYELLTRRRPFSASSKDDLLRQVTSLEPKPPRQLNERIPRELERICQKSMAKIARDRYSSAFDMADDLRHFVSQIEETDRGSKTVTVAVDEAPVSESPTPAADSTTDRDSKRVSAQNESFVSSGQREIRIVPKGIRSFDAHDADFFLKLLPGALDRDGLPDLIRFWKTKIEETDNEKTFSAGLIYGPSGCGKSSFVSAGLLPRLTSSVMPILVEATAENTESRLLRSLRKQCPTLPEVNSLVETVKALRTGLGPAQDKKILIVIDQFEQWLHSHDMSSESELIQALRQCDGARVQCILMVRDDFWMAVTQFMRSLEVRIAEGQNSAAVELFPRRHAIKVLDAFGRAFGTLPDETSELSDDQKAFLSESVDELANDDKVICVRLSLFAEIMRNKTWSVESLRSSGGVKGVGVTFLEETFSASTAAPENRFHQKAARRVLRALLPDSGTNIRGHMRSHQELKEASGYHDRDRDFEELISILDGEIRLITPTDPDGVDDEDDDSVSPPTREDGTRYYQLTHDYLVPALRSWLTRKQRETRRGRAELLLQERTSLWHQKQENRYLPTLGENIRIHLLTDRNRWDDNQRAMAKRARRVQGRSALGWLTAVAVVSLCVFLIIRASNEKRLEAKNASDAEHFCEMLQIAKFGEIESLVDSIAPLRKWADPLLRDEMRNAEDGSTEKLRLAIGLLPVDRSQQDYLVDQLPKLEISAFPIVRDVIEVTDDNIDQLWELVMATDASPEHQFQACCALATYAPDDSRWDDIAMFVVNHLAGTTPPFHLNDRLDQLSPAKDRLIDSLNVLMKQTPDEERTKRENAAIALAQFTKEDVNETVIAILNCRRLFEFRPLIDSLRESLPEARQRLLEIVNDDSGKPFPSPTARENHFRRRGIAGATLIHFDDLESVVPLLRRQEDLTLRSYIGHFFQHLPVPYRSIMAESEKTSDTPTLRMLIQSIGYLDRQTLPDDTQQQIVEWLKEFRSQHADSGVHSMSEWALKRWGTPLTSEPTFAHSRLTEETRRSLTRLNSEANQLRARINEVESQRSSRQTKWEQGLATETGGDLPDPVFELSLEESDLDDDDELADAFAQLQVKPTWKPGIHDDAVRLQSGPDLGLNLGEAVTLDESKPFSIGCWYLSSRESQYAALFSKMGTESQYRQGFDLWINGETVGAHLVQREYAGEGTGDLDNDLIKVITKGTFPERKWRHLMVTYDGKMNADGMHVFIDGVRQEVVEAHDTLTGPIACDAPFTIGSRSDGFAFDGWIDDVRVYDRVLVDDQIAQLHQSGLSATARRPPEQRDDDQQHLLDLAFTDETNPELYTKLAELNHKLSELSWTHQTGWIVNGQNQLMIVVPMTSSDNIKGLGYPFAIGAHEVTIRQYEEFATNINTDPSTAPSRDCPMHNMSWHEAARYCNWLSEKEGIDPDQWCFQIDNEIFVLKDNYLELSGYRMATVDEWQTACLAGSQGDFFFGSSDELSKDYVWHVRSSLGQSHPVGSLLPNDFGLFDTHGNSWEYNCTVSADPEKRELRGGAFNSVITNVKRNSNTRTRATDRSNYYGFRIARTLSSAGSASATAK